MEYDKKANRKYKDSVFTTLFSDEKNAIELYNAIDGKNYPPDIEIEINTLDDVLYLDRINDVSFIIDNKLVVLVEQQSSINLNMPLRFLLYISRIYERIIAANELNIYKRNLTKIPRPEFICLYNGKEDFPDEKILKLSDAFMEVEGHHSIDLDLTVRVININKDKNRNMVKESKALSDYVFFISQIQMNIENGFSLESAINETVKYCISNGILEDFLKQYRSEVINMLAKEFDMELALRAAEDDGIEKGIEKGVELEKKEVIIKLLNRGVSDDDIIALMSITADKLTQYKTMLSNTN